MARYDDSEDRGLTSEALTEWETVYVPTAIVYTEVPEKLKSWMRQQTRWRKGYLRSCTYISCFFWRKNPLMSLIFYTEFMQSFLSPLLFSYVYIYVPLFLSNYMFTLAHFGGQLLIGLGSGLDYKFREPTTKNWAHKPLMGILTFAVIPWLLFPALWTYRKNLWLTR
jgi:hyaluronan synthase